jgi:predicted RNase H-like HicB family nuclease
MTHHPLKMASQASREIANAAIRFWIKTAREDGQEIPLPRGRRLVA